MTKAMSYARRYNLTREDRLQLAEVLLWRDVASWKTLSEPELCRVLDALEGYALITHLRWSKGERSDCERVDGAPSVGATDAIRRQPVGGLEPGDEVGGRLAEPAVDDDVVEQLGPQHALEVGDKV